MHKSIEERFWKYTVKTDSCWIWNGWKSPYGYGDLIHWPTRKHYRVHRISYELHKGEIPNGLLVLHKCDVKLCVNPNHLFLGTQAENIKDKVEKGRQARGEKIGISKLNENQIKEIRDAYIKKEGSQRLLAKKYGVHQSTIWRAVNYLVWKHIST